MRWTARMLAAIAIAAVGVTSINCQKQGASQVVVGVDLPLTGNLSFYGNELRDALTLVQQEHAASGVTFAFEDNQSEANGSVTVFNKFALNGSMPIIVSCNSPLSSPLRPLAERNKKVLLALVTGARDFGMENQWCFRDAINQDQEGEALATYLVEKTPMRRGATFVVNDDYGLGGALAFAGRFEKLGGTITSKETFEMSDRDMRAKVAKLLDAKPEFVFIVGREQTIITSINQIRERNATIPIVATDSFDSPNVRDGVGQNAKGVLFASYYNDLAGQQGKAFVDLFTQRFGRAPGIYAIDAYVAGQYIMQLVAQSRKDSEALRVALAQMRYDSPIKGALHVTEKRDVLSPVAIYAIGNQLEKQVVHVVQQ
jgi:branched-chain amino acid transport system substrate-binding protein